MNNFRETSIPEFTNSSRGKSYSEILSKVSQTAKILVLNDLKLMKEELRTLGKDVGKQSKHAAIFGYLALLSAMPLMVAAIIGLGQALDGRYWLSALIIGATLCIVGVSGVIYAVKKLTKINFKLSKTSSALQREGEVIYRQFNKLQAMANEGLKNEEEGHRAAY